MLAAKHLDPVIGVDIHLIQPPGPVPPVPIPHPFVGFLIDPADYVPIVGSTVLINNLHRAQAGTAGKCVPPHIPIGGVFVPPPPGNECEMFMGSATVECDGDALSYMALPALSCQSVGMPSIPRISPKKKTIPKCLMLPTSQVLPIPAGPPVLVGGPPTISIMGMAMKAGMAALGKLAKAFKKLQKGSKRAKAISKRMHAAAKKAMDKLGVPPSARNRVHRAICSVTGHPVDIATGKVFTDAIDFQLPGPLPLVWERVWFSTSTYNGPLGRGWHHSYDLGLVDEGEAIAVRLADGRPVAFPPINEGESAFDRTERLTLLRDVQGYLLRDSAGLQYRFGRVEFDTPVQKLLSVSNLAEFRIEFSYDRNGKLSEISDSAGRYLPVLTDSCGRITEIRGPHPDKPDATITLVSYEYDSAARLITIRDALKQPMLFEYTSAGLLIRETDRNGLSFWFKYDAADQDARCIHTYGDGGIYERRLEYDRHLKRTIVINSLGHQTVHYWNDSGLVYRAIDPIGDSNETTFNEFNQITATINALGHQTTYEYDSRGNQAVILNPDGTSLKFSYNNLDLPVQAIDLIGNNWKWEYNKFGQLTRRVEGNGSETQFVYERRLLSAILDPALAATEISHDTAGLISAITGPDGRQTRWQYDTLGRASVIVTPHGTQRRTCDLLGRITRIEEPDGNIRSFSYDSMGNLLHAKDLQYDIRLNYMGTGRLVSRREAGTTVEFRYNTEEDLVEIVNEHRHSYRFELDARGDVVREFGFNQLRRIYTRDSSGRIIRVERDSGLITWYTYDQLGRLCAVKYSDDSHEGYQYRPDGELIEASNDDCTVRFERDASGRIQREWQDDLWIESEYGENGLRHSVHSCFGAIQRIERSATGDVLGMRYLDLQRDPTRIVWETQIQRDSAGLELERSLPNGITSRWDRDELGRTTRHRVFGASTQNLDAEYIWDVNARLKRIVDSQYGTTTFEHDDLGNLAAATYGDGRIELRLPDAIGNLFRTKDRTDRKYDRAGAILESRDEQGLTTYEHDAEGNLIRKCTPTGDWHYTWNAAGMLKSVGRPDGKKIEFAYDPLGRRIRKTAEGRTTRWIWDGNNPLHEWVECDEPANESSSEVAANHSPSGQTVPPDTTVGLLTDTDNALLPIPVGLITWMFEPESFTPALKVVGGQAFSIVTDFLGTPREMLDQSGHTVWSSEISVFGDVRNLSGDRPDCPFRWPGQYVDAETALSYNRFRYYDASTGFYISQDPIRLESGVYHLYLYVRDPYSLVDPFGLDWNYRLVDSNGRTYYHGRASDNQTMADVARRHSTTMGTDGSRFGPGDTMQRITDPGTPKDAVRGIEQRGTSENRLLGRGSSDVRGNKISGIADAKISTPRGQMRLQSGDQILAGRKPSEMPALAELKAKPCS